MLAWKDDNELFAIMRSELYSAVIGDILDKMGYLHQFLPQRIQPIHTDMVVAGRAMTVLEADTFEELSDGQNPIMKKPFGLMLEALEQRRRRWIRPEKDIPDGYLNIYRAVSRSSAQGAVLALD